MIRRRGGDTLGRLVRRRANRVERGLSPHLTTPVPAGSMNEPLPPAETRADQPRPPTATFAGITLIGLGLALAATVIVELGTGIVAGVTAPAVDPMTALVHWFFAGVLALILAGIVGVAGLHLYAGWRVLSGVNWGWIEGLVMSVVGGVVSAVTYGMTLEGEPVMTVPLLVALGAYALVVASLFASRPWFGDIRAPLRPERAPWWFRPSRWPW